MKAAALARVQAELDRLIRYDDESIVHEAWIRQRYDGGYAAAYGPARRAAVRSRSSWTPRARSPSGCGTGPC